MNEQDPHNLEAERAVLGSILIDSASAFPPVVPILTPEDFFEEKNERIYRGMLDLFKRSGAVDLLTLKEELNGGGPETVDAAYLSALINSSPDLGNVEQYAGIVKEKATRRAAIQAAERLIQDALSEEKTVEALSAQAGKLEEMLRAAGRAGPVPVTVDEVLASMPPPTERLATGISSLDNCSRGGCAPRRVYQYVAPPGKGKTAMLAQLCRTFAARGAPVYALFHDEGSWQAGVMIAEGAGFDRDALENDYAAIRAAVKEKMDSLGKLLAPPGETLDDAERWVRETLRRNPAAVPVVVIDSVQAVRASRDAAPENRKEQAEAVMARERKIAALGAVVLSASKANRASWSKKRPGDNTEPLASGLDSSSIEYESDALFFLSGDPAERTFLQVCKNRPGDGTKPTIALGFNRDRATFFEIDAAAAKAEEEESEREREAAKLSADEKRVLNAVRSYPGRSGNMLREILKMNKARTLVLLEELERKGKILKDGGGWFLKDGTQDEDES